MKLSLAENDSLRSEIQESHSQLEDDIHIDIKETKNKDKAKLASEREQSVFEIQE